MFAETAYVQEIQSSSLFFFQQDPKALLEAYGENQQRYRQFSNEVVEDLIDDIRFAQQWNCIDKILSKIIIPLGCSRKKIAKELKSLEADAFGSLRTADIHNATILSGSLYNKAANSFINSLIQGLLKILPNPFFSIEGMLENTIQGVKYLLPQSNTSISETSVILRTSSDIERITQELTASQNLKNSNSNIFHAVFSDTTIEGTMLSLDLKQWSRLSNFVKYYEKELPPLEDTKSFYYHVETKLKTSEVDSIGLSDLLLRFDLNLIHYTIEVQPPLIVHMNSEFLEIMIQNIDRDIETLLKLPPLAPMESIIHQIGMIRYKFAHALPYIRGSAAVGEWIETALYRYMGIQNFRQTAETTIDLEAFSSLSYEDFITRYRAIIDPLRLMRIQSSDNPINEE